MSRLGEPLTYPLAGLLREPPGTTRLYPVAGVTIDLGARSRSRRPDRGHGPRQPHKPRRARPRRVSTRRSPRSAAAASATSRCPLELEIEEEALPSIDLETGRPIDWSDEPDALRLNGAHELELEPVVREAIQLAEPIAPLCRDDCPGLCAVCGADLSGGPHAHEEEIDPRLEALRAFRVDGDARNPLNSRVAAAGRSPGP